MTFSRLPSRPRPLPGFGRLLRSRSDIHGAHFFLGLAADALGETGEAVAQYRAALKDNPNDSAVYTKLGLISESTGKSDEAIALFQKAVQLNPANTSARLNLAIKLVQRGNYGQGLKELDVLLRYNPHDAAAHFTMGFAFLSTQRIDEAIAKFRQGLRYKPDDAEAHFGLGAALATLPQARRRRDGTAGGTETSPKLSTGTETALSTPAMNAARRGSPLTGPGYNSQDGATPRFY